METIMNKTGNSSQYRELQDDELDAVSGGLYVNPITMILFGVVLPAVKSLLP
jgi:hypothetical protein